MSAKFEHLQDSSQLFTCIEGAGNFTGVRFSCDFGLGSTQNCQKQQVSKLIAIVIYINM